MIYRYKTKGTCSSYITIDIDGDIIRSVQFTGGCPGNTAAVAKLVAGMSVEQIENILKGIHCGVKSTSCGDQLAKAVREAYNAAQGA